MTIFDSSPTKAQGPTKRCVFFAAEPPISNLNGAASYNAAILDALLGLGYQVDVIATTARLWPLKGLGLGMPEGATLKLVHGRLGDHGIAPNSLGARLRGVKRTLQDILRSLPLSKRKAHAEAPAKVAWFGKQLTAQELSASAKLVENSLPYDVAVISTIYHSEVLKIANLAKRNILIAHDIFHQRKISFEKNHFTVMGAPSPEDELHLWKKFDAIVAISDSDRNIIKTLTNSDVVTFFPSLPQARANIVHFDSSSPNLEIFFIGMSAYANVDAITWFLDVCWPKIIEAHPEAILNIVGKVGEEIRHVPPGVKLLGRVDDLSSIASRCCLAIAPLRMGSGIKIKMLDYFRLGLPCVASPISAEGFPSDPPAPFQASEESAFADTILALLGDPAQRAALIARIPAYLTQFSSEAAARNLASALNSP